MTGNVVHKPRVSIGLPVYNGEQFVSEAIASLLAQTFTDFELIICDNASTDRTGEICTSYAARDPRVRYVRNPNNIGAGPNYNLAFELARGEYFKWASHDDVCAPRFLEQCVAVLDREPSVVLSYPQMVDIDEDGKTLPDRTISHIPRAERGASPKPHRRLRQLLRTDYTCEEVFGVVRSDVLRKTSLILSYTDSDRTLLGELALYGTFAEVPEMLFLHRMHKGMSTLAFKGWNERTAWFDPAKAGKPVFPITRQIWEYVRAVARAPLGFGERVRCYLMLLHWFRKFLIPMLREWVINLLRTFRHAAPRSDERRRVMADASVKSGKA